jgi:ribosomal-protein-alanine N-acetyltransferase
MIKGEKIILRTIKAVELEIVYEKISNINRKGPYWHLNLPSEQDFRREFLENGCWGDKEGRMLIMKKPASGNDGLLSGKHTKTEYLGELIYFKGFDYQSGIEVGYEIFDPENYGKGYISEALTLFSAYMFAVRPINRIQVNLMHENIGSRRVVEKCGFHYEGTMRKATFHRGEYHDLDLFSLLREECPTLESMLEAIQEQ